MSFIGTGGEDWVEFDLDLFERFKASRLESVLVDGYQRVASVLGADFEVDTTDDGLVFIVIDGQRRYRAEVNRADRLILTGILDPEGPL